MCFVFQVPSAAPTELMVTRIKSSSNIRLNWTSIPSEYINAPALLGYIVEYQEVGALALQTNKTSDTWLELTLPKNDTQYLFTVSGYNERERAQTFHWLIGCYQWIPLLFGVTVCFLPEALQVLLIFQIPAAALSPLQSHHVR